MAIPEVDKSLTKALREIPEKGKSENGRINTGDLWWAWVDLNHRPRPYQGLLWCYMHSSVAMITVLTTAISRSGKPLRAPMPRFHMIRSDAEAVVTYLKSLNASQ